MDDEICGEKMINPKDKLIELRRRGYEMEKVVDNLGRVIYEQHDYSRLRQFMEAQDQLKKTGEEIYRQEQWLVDKTLNHSPIHNGTNLSSWTKEYYQNEEVDQVRDGQTLRGFESTGLQVEIHPRMHFVPTAIYHLFEESELPLVECVIRTNSSELRRLRVTAYIERYSAQTVKTVEVGFQNKIVYLLPTLFPEMVRQILELTRASLNMKVEDLDTGRVEEHQTWPIWLLAHNAVPFEVRDPNKKELRNLRNYLAAMITPNQPDIQLFLKSVNKCHPTHQLIGYLDPLSNPPRDQVEAIYKALKQADIGYTRSGAVFNPDQDANSQRIRLPRETLHEKQANCIEGALLFASLLEAIHLNSVIALNGSHAFVGWQNQQDTQYWDYIDTTFIEEMDFDGAVQQTNSLIAALEEYETSYAASLVTRLNIQELRLKYGIYPLE